MARNLSLVRDKILWSEAVKLADCKVDNYQYRIFSATILEEAETLALPHNIGGVLEGVAAGQRVDPYSDFGPKGKYASGTSAIARVGDNLGPLIHLPGSDWTLQRLSLFGRKWDDAKPRPKAGVLVSSPKQEGLGTGSHRFQQVHVEHVDDAFVMGESLLEHNCEMCKFDQVRVKDCRSVIRSNCQMSMGHVVQELQCQNVDFVFDMEAGGDIEAYGVRVTEIAANQHCVVLRIGTGYGSNNRTFLVNQITLDQSCGTRVSMLDVADTRPVHCTFAGGEIDCDDYEDQPLWIIPNGSNVTITGWENIPRGSVMFKDYGQYGPGQLTLAGNGLSKSGKVADILNPESDSGWIKAFSNSKHVVTGHKSDGARLNELNRLTKPTKRVA